MRLDLERLEGKPDLSEFVEKLRKRGVDDSVLAAALAEVKAEAS